MGGSSAAVRALQARACARARAPTYPPMDSSTSTPPACSAVMALLSAEYPPSAALESCRPARLMLAEPGTYTMVGEKKPRKRRVMGSVAAEPDSADSLARPSAPFSRAYCANGVAERGREAEISAKTRCRTATRGELYGPRR